MIRSTLFLILGTFTLCTQTASAAEYFLKIVRTPIDVERITVLSFPADISRVESKFIGQAMRGYTILHGKFGESDWNLLVGTKKISLSSDGEFKVALPVNGPKALVQFTAINPRGEVQKERIEIVFDNWEQFKKEELQREGLKRFHFGPNLGFSYISYQQTGVENINEFVVTGKVAMSYVLFPPHWDIGANAYMNIIPITTSSPGNTIRFFGTNFRIGYALPFIKEPWRLTFMGGVYYTTTIASGNFGFTGMGGPQLFPVIRKLLGGGKSAFMYFKFSPVTNGAATILSIANREIAGGGGYSWQLKNKRFLTLTLDIASLQLSLVDPLVGTVSSNTTSVSLGMGYGF
jgi:hypothetical protein